MGVFLSILQRIGINHQYIWAGSEKFSSTEKDHEDDTRLRKGPAGPVLKRDKKASTKQAYVKFENVNDDISESMSGHRVVFRASIYPPSNAEEDGDIEDEKSDFDDPDTEF